MKPKPEFTILHACVGKTRPIHTHTSANKGGVMNGDGTTQKVYFTNEVFIAQAHHNWIIC